MKSTSSVHIHITTVPALCIVKEDFKVTVQMYNQFLHGNLYFYYISSQKEKARVLLEEKVGPVCIPFMVLGQKLFKSSWTLRSFRLSPKYNQSNQCIECH